MSRITSSLAYSMNLSSGVLTERRGQCYGALGILQDALRRPATSAEVWKRIHAQFSSIPQHSINPRWVELKQQGVVEEAGTRICTVSNRECIAWSIVEGSIARPFKPVRVKHQHKHDPKSCVDCRELFDSGRSVLGQMDLP